MNKQRMNKKGNATAFRKCKRKINATKTGNKKRL